MDNKSYLLSSLRKSSCEWHDLPSSPQPQDNTLTFGSLTVPSAVNRSTGRTYMSWEGFLGKPNWIWVWNQTFLQTSGSTLAAAKTKVNGKVKHCLFFVCKITAPDATEQWLQLMEWNRLKMVIYLSLETICSAVGYNPKKDLGWLKRLMKSGQITKKKYWSIKWD